jgi:Holliday junction resolvasome RuvABC endonuclease subunit
VIDPKVASLKLARFLYGFSEFMPHRYAFARIGRGHQKQSTSHLISTDFEQTSDAAVDHAAAAVAVAARRQQSTLFSP